MRTTLQNEADCCLPLNSVIASEPFIVMQTIERKLKGFEKELDGLDSSAVEINEKTSTARYGDAYMVAFDLRNSDTTKTRADKKGFKKYNQEDYKPGDTASVADGTYLHIVKVHPVYMEDGLFGFTYPTGSLSVYVRGDLRGEALRRVVRHEVAHHALKADENEARSLTGTHMGDFLPIYNRMKHT